MQLFLNNDPDAKAQRQALLQSVVPCPMPMPTLLLHKSLAQSGRGSTPFTRSNASWSLQNKGPTSSSKRRVNIHASIQWGYERFCGCGIPDTSGDPDCLEGNVGSSCCCLKPKTSDQDQRSGHATDDLPDAAPQKNNFL